MNDRSLPVRLGAVLSLALLAAHALRTGDMGGCAFFLGLAALSFTRRAFTRPVLAAALVYGTFLWTRTALDMVRFRMLFGEPWLRMALIMAAVAGLGLAALGALLAKPGVRAFHRYPRAAGVQGAAFILTAGLLFIARAKAPLPLLLLDRFLPGWGGLEILGLSFYAAWIAGLMADPAKAAVVRGRYWSLFSAVFFLQLALGLLGASVFLMTGALHLPVPALILGGPLYRGGGYFMPILFGCALLLIGPGWCGHLCYIGAWDDRLSRLSGKTRKPLPPWARHGRLGALILTILLALGFRFLGVPALPAVLTAAAFGLCGVFVMLLVSRKLGLMAHCTAWCPMGLVADVLGKISPWRLRIGENCDACGRCARVCRYGALTPAGLKAKRPGLTCSLCGDCVGACKKAQIGYSLFGVSPNNARLAYLALAVSLHAVFLGLARI